MSITGIKKRLACFYDDKGDYIGCCGFSKVAKTFEYEDRRFNIFHDNVTYTIFKRWYWDVEVYHYNINNPNPFDLTKKCEPVMDAEVYNTHMKTEVLKKLNDLANPGFKWNWKILILIAIALGIIYMLYTGGIKLK